MEAQNPRQIIDLLRNNIQKVIQNSNTIKHKISIY